MSFVETIVVEFVANHLNERLSTQQELIERLKALPIIGHDENLDDRPDYEPILQRFILLDRQFIEDKHVDKLPELTEPLIPHLKSGSRQNYYKAFKTIADELFADSIGWIQIVTFLVYCAELVNKVLELPHQKDKEKTFKMISQVIRCSCRYFEENLLQWIDEQEGGWSSIIDSTADLVDDSGKRGLGNSCRGVKQYIGVAAFAVVIGSIYLCSKLTVQ